MSTKKQRFGLPHFNLAKARAYDPQLLLKSASDEMGSIFLAFASVLNDLKGVLWLDQVLLDSKPDEETIDEVSGQWHGMHELVTKYILGIVHEFLVVLQKNKDLVLSDEMEGYVRMLPKAARKKWRTLVRIAHGERSRRDDELSKYLARVRHNLSFHYYDPKTLARGYIAHFSSDSDDPRYQKAFLSHGSTMASTRYYYADAAVESAIEVIFESDRVNTEIKLLVDDISGSVSGLILAFIQMRERDAHSR